MQYSKFIYTNCIIYTNCSILVIFYTMIINMLYKCMFNCKKAAQSPAYNNKLPPFIFVGRLGTLKNRK